MEFYEAMKGLNEQGYIRSVFLTGITKLFFVNRLSPLTIWLDYSLDSTTADLIGFTEQEILSRFSDEEFKFVYSKHFGCDIKSIKDEGIEQVKKKVMKELKKMYDGYRFTRENTHVFNSESIWKCFKYGDIISYWNDAVSAEFQWNQILKEPKLSKSILSKERILDVKEEVLKGYRACIGSDTNRVLAAAYQTGLLTIESYNKKPTLIISKYQIMKLDLV
eukprot:GAHX01002058.1.p1 GENE.GAHX01002058.1~~GAHX01002058.1.p1  ORF type:complete len:220 (-),score=34.19 GAHX01002058.1:231-890(-)